MQVVAALFVLFNTWGMLNTFRVFQTYYESSAIFQGELVDHLVDRLRAGFRRALGRPAQRAHLRPRPSPIPACRPSTSSSAPNAQHLQDVLAVSQRRRLDRRRSVMLPNPNSECRVKAGRTVPNYLLDKFGRMDLFGSAAMICGILILSMVAVKTLVRATFVSLFFGFFSGVFVALPPVCFG
ncbi:major facilitator superfamily transporter [Seiridium cupressi]